MKALVKKERKPGLWLEDVPKPAVGINDVLIRVDRTGICGTDLHIYKWDDWAQRTIPTPMVVGHEFVGEVAEVGSNVTDFFPGEVVSAEGHVRLRTLPQLSRRPSPPVQGHPGHRGEPARRVRRIHFRADDERVASPAGH